MWIGGILHTLKDCILIQRDIMREPIDNKIYFAGEAFHSIYYQTLHGAVESGEDVAKLL